MDGFVGARAALATPSSSVRSLDETYADVGAQVREAIEQNSIGEFRDTLTRIMAQPGQVLAPPSEIPWWTVFVVQGCVALGGERAAAEWPAAAVEFAVGAINVGDDLGDGQWNPCWSSLPRAANAGAALGFLVQYSLGRAAEHLGQERAHLIGDLLARGCMLSCGGQDLDFLLEEEAFATEEQAHQAMWQKSGELVGTAFQVGAACATDDSGAIGAIRNFGIHAGIVGQLGNDLEGIDPGGKQRGTDVIQRKKTVPVAYALKVAAEEGISEITDWYAGLGSPNLSSEERVAQRMADLGAFHYTLAVAETHRDAARAALRDLEKRTGKKSVRDLAGLIGRIELRRA